MFPLSATLVSLSDAPNIRVDSSILLVGRGPDCDVVVDSRKVSRKHCCLAIVGNFLVVRDLGSTNGVRINGQRRDESRLFEGDELIIANLRYRLEWDQAKPGSSSKHRALPVMPPELVNPSDSFIERCDQPVMLADQLGADPSEATHREPARPNINPAIPNIPRGVGLSSSGWISVGDEDERTRG